MIKITKLHIKSIYRLYLKTVNGIERFNNGFPTDIIFQTTYTNYMQLNKQFLNK